MNQERVTGPRQNVRIALFALSGNQCAFPDCDAPVFADGTILGEVCHIHAQSPAGPRYREGLSGEKLHRIDNLLLLCQRHHKTVDDHPEQYNAEQLRKMKEDHESRATVTPTQILLRLIEALAPDLPDNWWERPGAPVFRLSQASSRPDSGQWVFEVDLEQIDGDDLGNMRFRYRLGETENQLKSPKLLKRRKWHLDNLAFQPSGKPIELELRFWWGGAERSLTYRWEREKDFQASVASPHYSL